VLLMCQKSHIKSTFLGLIGPCFGFADFSGSSQEKTGNCRKFQTGVISVKMLREAHFPTRTNPHDLIYTYRKTGQRHSPHFTFEVDHAAGGKRRRYHPNSSIRLAPPWDSSWQPRWPHIPIRS